VIGWGGRYELVQPPDFLKYLGLEKQKLSEITVFWALASYFQTDLEPPSSG
jgi:hypothetical protein